jgi:hypothetical protein
LLLANLLSPVGGGPLSQFVSQQEYSKLLDADGIGGALVSEWRDDGYLDQRASIFATYGRLSLGIDFLYHYDNGNRPNNRNSRLEGYWQLKYQVSPDDVFYTLGKWQDEETGDLFQSYSDLPGNLGLDFEEKQEPGLQLFGWNHRWGPGVHTLFLGGRLSAEQVLTAPGTSQLLLQRDSAFLSGFAQSGGNGTPPATSNPDGSLNVSESFRRALAPTLGRGPVTATFGEQFDFATQRQFEVYSGEVQHIWQTKRNTLLAGARWQSGEFETNARLDLSNPASRALFTSPASLQSVSVDFERQTIYAYDFFKFSRALTLIGGVSWDHIERPENFRNPPVSEKQEEKERWSGKAGFTFAPADWLIVRGAYTEGLGGVTFDESVRLEPVQIAGFNQAFRTLISESIVGSVEAPRYKSWGLSIEGALPTRTWWGMSLNIVEEDLERTVGAFDYLVSPVFPAGAAALPSGTRERLAYREEIVTVNANQLIGREFAVGAGYRFTRAELRDTFLEIPVALTADADRFHDEKLHEVTIYANWNSPTGWFARAEANWYAQDLDGALAGARIDGLPGDDFWQFNVQLGYRFYRNLCEVSAGVLNLSDTDYRISPLTYTRELPRERTFFIRTRLSF